MKLKASIIIPVRTINDYVRESVPYILKQNYSNFEILIFPDEPTDESFEKTGVIPTGPIGPADKRDLALKHAAGEILAFLDDDAYPREDWLSNALRHFKDPDIAAVGGPAMTPDSDNIWQKASGGIFETFTGGGVYAFRYVPRKKRYVDDFPSVNLFIRRSVFERAGGFDSHYWPGEDTKLCLDITGRQGKKIIYDPEVLVWHHRRELFSPHLKQIGNYALHRGKFAREFPETSFRFSYFLPSIFLSFLFTGGFLSLSSLFLRVPYVASAYLFIIFFYLTLIFLDVLRFRNWKLAFLVAAGIVTTHLWYGTMFIVGLFRKELKR